MRSCYRPSYLIIWRIFYVCMVWWFVAVRDRAVLDGNIEHHRRPVRYQCTPFTVFFYDSVRVQSAPAEVIVIRRAVGVHDIPVVVIRLDDQAVRLDPPTLAFLEHGQPMRDLFAELRHERVVGLRSVYRVYVVHKLGWQVVVHTL